MSSVILADNRFLDGTPVAQYTAAGYSALNVRDGRTYTAWMSDRSGTQTITVDCGAGKGADTIALAGTNFKGQVPPYIAVESSDNGSLWTSRLAAVQLPSTTRDRAYLKTFVGATARYWRVQFQSTFSPKVAVLMVGMRIGFPRTPDAPFAPVSLKRVVDMSKSKTGQMIGAVSRYSEVGIAPRWTFIEYDFIENKMLPFYRDYAGGMNPFFWCWDIFNYANDVYFVRLKEGMEFQPQKSNSLFYDNFSLDLEGVIE